MVFLNFSDEQSKSKLFQIEKLPKSMQDSSYNLWNALYNIIGNTKDTK